MSLRDPMRDKKRRAVRPPPEEPEKKKRSGYDPEKDVVLHALGDLNAKGTWIADIRSYDEGESKLCVHKVKRNGSVRTVGRVPLREASALYLALCAFDEDEDGFAEFMDGDADAGDDSEDDEDEEEEES